MKTLVQKAEAFLEWGGIQKEIALLAVSGAALVVSIFDLLPLPFDAAWVAIVLCGVPIVLEALIGLIAAILVVVLSLSGNNNKVVSVLRDALKIAAPVLLLLALFYFVATRMEGLAYIYGSNSDILATIQTPENLASTYVAIASFVLFGIAAIVGIVAAFFGAVKKED